MNKFIKQAKLSLPLAEMAVIEGRVRLSGAWVWQAIDEKKLLKTVVRLEQKGTIIVDASALVALDMIGAHFITRLLNSLSTQTLKPSLQGMSDDFQPLLQLVQKQEAAEPAINAGEQPARFDLLEALGRHTIEFFQEAVDFFAFVGESLVSFIGLVRHWRHFHWHQVLDVVDTAGVGALWIIALLIFLVGVVICYQIGIQLSVYGANIYVVNLMGISILREFGPLISAIIIAGRSGSAFAAEIGAMRIQEEVDALQTIGISPFRRLVLPRMLGLLLMMPLLVSWADVWGMLGGMVMAKASFAIEPKIFFDRLINHTYFINYVIGLIKAPVFALLIASVGCFRGFRVAGSTVSVGRETTRSVVQAIFLIIVADAIFSIIFSTVGL